MAFLIINIFFLNFSYPCQWSNIHRMETKIYWSIFCTQPTVFLCITAPEHSSLFKKLILCGICLSLNIFSINSNLFYSIIYHICSYRQLTPLSSESLQHNYCSFFLSLTWRCTRDNLMIPCRQGISASQHLQLLSAQKLKS